MFLLWWVSESYLPLAAFAVVFGTFYGGYVALTPTVCMDLFGPRALSAIIGSLYTAAGLGTLVGPTFAGATFDAFGSYDVAILACAALCFAGAVIAAVMRRRFAHRA
jgi:MFS family permease